MVDVNYVMLLFVAVIMAVAYGILGYFAERLKTGAAWEWDKFAATVVYSIIVGVVAVQSGLITLVNVADWQIIFSPVWVTFSGVYLGLLYFFSKFVVPAISSIATVTRMSPFKVAGAAGRKMDPESKQFLVFDLPETAKAPTLACVAQAEALNLFQYAIESGAWIFLIENGELTGSKHYYFRGWFGSSPPTWKPISAKCLEACRKSGRIPDYSALY